MKYLLLATILLGCKNEPRKVFVRTEFSDTISQVSRDTTSIDIHDPYKTGKDTVRLNAVMDKLFNFPEVEAINKEIIKTSKGRHGVSIQVHDEFERDTSYYIFMVGDNSHDDRYVNVFNFLLDKKSGQIKAYDPLLDSVMNLEDWRKARKKVTR